MFHVFICGENFDIFFDSFIYSKDYCVGATNNSISSVIQPNKHKETDVYLHCIPGCISTCRAAILVMPDRIRQLLCLSDSAQANELGEVTALGDTIVHRESVRSKSRK